MMDIGRLKKKKQHICKTQLYLNIYMLRRHTENFLLFGYLYQLMELNVNLVPHALS